MPIVLTEQEANRIIAALEAKNVLQRPCPICGQDRWTLIDGYTPMPIRSTASDSNLVGAFETTVSLFCLNCGFIRQHAVRVLNLV